MSAFDSSDVKIVRDYSELVELREHWDDLFDASPTASAPLRFEWLSEWWRVYGPVYGAGGGGLSVVTVWNDGRLVGALPLYQRVHGGVIGHARLQFLSTGEAQFEETCPEYLGLLTRPGEDQAVAAAIQAALFTPTAPRWDDLVLMDVSEHSPLLPAWCDGVARGYSVVTETRGECPFADLRGGFEAYLGRLSGNSRRQARKILRAAQQVGATLEVMSTRTEAEACFDDLVELHQARWRAVGKAGCFSASRFTEFHRSLVQLLVPRSAAVLARLRVGGDPLAVIYGFVTGNKFDFYQSGVRLDACHGLARPGIVTHLLLMSELAERGVTEYDFLRGSSAYKQRLSTGVHPLVRLHVVRRTLRSTLWATAGLGRRAMRKVLRTFGGARPRRVTHPGLGVRPQPLVRDDARQCRHNPCRRMTAGTDV